VAGIHAKCLSSVVASSISPPGANSDVKRFHVSAAPWKKITSMSLKCGNVGARSHIFSTTAEFCHSSPSSVAVK
jgi:hypothetical protein